MWWINKWINIYYNRIVLPTRLGILKILWQSPPGLKRSVGMPCPTLAFGALICPCFLCRPRPSAWYVFSSARWVPVVFALFSPPAASWEWILDLHPLAAASLSNITVIDPVLTLTPFFLPRCQIDMGVNLISATYSLQDLCWGTWIPIASTSLPAKWCEYSLSWIIAESTKWCNIYLKHPVVPQLYSIEIVLFLEFHKSRHRYVHLTVSGLSFIHFTTT